MDISDPEIDHETLRPIYKISVCSSCKHKFIPKVKGSGKFYSTCESCREHQDIHNIKYRLKNRV
jgi:hypothetical protein